MDSMLQTIDIVEKSNPDIIDINLDGEIGLNELKESEVLPFIHGMLYLYEPNNVPEFSLSMKEDKKWLNKMGSHIRLMHWPNIVLRDFYRPGLTLTRQL